jgi:hypothetical protein
VARGVDGGAAPGEALLATPAEIAHFSDQLSTSLRSSARFDQRQDAANPDDH